MSGNYLAIDVVSAYVYFVIFVLLFLSGYIKSAMATFELLDSEKDDALSTLVWFPIAHFIVWGSLAGKKKLGVAATVTVSLTAICIIATAIISIITKELLVAGLILSIVLYIANATVDFLIFNALFKKYERGTTKGQILFSSFIPLFKYYLPFGEENN